MQGLGVLGEFEFIHMHTSKAEEDRERQMDKEQKKVRRSCVEQSWQ